MSSSSQQPQPLPKPSSRYYGRKNSTNASESAGGAASTPFLALNPRQVPLPPTALSQQQIVGGGGSNNEVGRGLPGLYQVIALDLTYRRICRAFLFLPKWTMIVTFVQAIVVWMFDVVTNGRAYVAIFVAATITVSAYVAIENLANTPQAAKKAIEKNGWYLPFASIVVGCAAARFLIGPILGTIQQHQQQRSFLLPREEFFTSIFFAVQLSFVVTILGLAVVARYVGPHSISKCRAERLDKGLLLFFSPLVRRNFTPRAHENLCSLVVLSLFFDFIGTKVRCSCIPLTMNPFDETIKRFLMDPMTIFLPSDVPGAGLVTIPGLSSSPSWSKNRQYQQQQHNNVGGGDESRLRYSRPSSVSIAVQVVVSVAAAVAIAFVAETGWFPFPEPRGSVGTRTATLWCLVLTVAASLEKIIVPLGHELDPQYRATPLQVLEQVVTRTFRWPAVLCPFLGIVAARFLVSDDDRIQSIMTDWYLYFQLCLISAVTYLYLDLLDEGCRFALFRPAKNLDQLVESFHHDATTLTKLDVVMHVVLRGSTSMVVELAKPFPASVAAIRGVEYEECRRLVEHSKRFAYGVVHSPYLLSSMSPSATIDKGGSGSEAPLEEDVLRVIILRSLVSDKAANPGSSNAALSTTSKHRDNSDFIQNLVDPKSPLQGPVGGFRKLRWDMCLPLVRALCVYVGGMGEALLVCAGKSSPAPNRPRIGGGIGVAAVNFWSIPPGFYVCAERAVQSISQCIVRSMTSTSGHLISDWKTSDLSILIPAALTSIFSLRRGIETFETEFRRRSPAIAVASTYSSLKKSDAIVAADTASDEKRQFDPRCWFLVDQCDNAAKEILACLGLPKGQAAVGRVDRLMGEVLEEDCSLWVKKVVLFL